MVIRLGLASFTFLRFICSRLAEKTVLVRFMAVIFSGGRNHQSPLPDLSIGFWKPIAQRAPGFFLRNVHDAWLRGIRGREDREEDQTFVERVVGAVNFALGNQYHFAGAEDSVLFADPLLGAAGQDVDDFLTRRVCVERVGAEWLHVRSDHE